MADTKTIVAVTLGYTNTDYTRTYTITDVDPAELANVKARAKAINTQLKSGTDNGLADFFCANDYDDSDPNNIIGKFNRIVALKSDSSEEVVIFDDEE